MAQFIRLSPRQNIGSDLGQAIGQGISGGAQYGLQKQFDRVQQEQQSDKEISALQKIIQDAPKDDPIAHTNAIISARGIGSELKKMYLTNYQSQLENQEKKAAENRNRELIAKLYGGEQQQSQAANSPNSLEGQPGQTSAPQQGGQAPQTLQMNQPLGTQQPQQRRQPAITQAMIAEAHLNKNPQLARDLTVLRGQQEKQIKQEQESIDRKTKQERDIFEGERKYHSEFAKDAIKEANGIRRSIPKKEMALDFARNAVESGDVSYFSPNKLADATGIDLFRTAKGAQLVTAGKENLLSNMDRVSAKAQNIWFEQRLNSMFAKIGQTEEANLTMQEMLEAEVAQDRAYLSEFDRLAKEDNQKYGFEKKDIEERARRNVEPIQKEIFDRATFRMKELEEQEKGLQHLKSQVGKHVVRGTPLTLAMMKLYSDKYGNNGLKEAKKDGYQIPTLEEYKIFQARPEEFREGLK